MAWTNNLPVEAATLTQLFPSSCCIHRGCLSALDFLLPYLSWLVISLPPIKQISFMLI